MTFLVRFVKRVFKMDQRSDCIFFLQLDLLLCCLQKPPICLWHSKGWFLVKETSVSNKICSASAFDAMPHPALIKSAKEKKTLGQKINFVVSRENTRCILGSYLRKWWVSQIDIINRINPFDSTLNSNTG